MAHAATPSNVTSMMSRPGTAMSLDFGYSMQRFNALTVDDLFREMKTSEVQYMTDLNSMTLVSLVEELLICHAALKPDLNSILAWAKEAGPIYSRYVDSYVLDQDDNERLKYLKRRPLVRLRFYSKFFKKLGEFLPHVPGISDQAAAFRVLVTNARAKVESEKMRAMRLQVDFSRVRSFDTLQSVATSFNSKYITMRSYCQCHLVHRAGKTFSGVPVEILLVAEPLMSDGLAICQLHEFHKYLLFPTFRRGDLVYTSTGTGLAIKLASYNNSELELEFSSTENKQVWATKFSEIFPPAPELPQAARRRTTAMPTVSMNVKGLQITTDSTSRRDSWDSPMLHSDILTDELNSPRLIDEPEIKPYIAGTDVSPQKKRNSVFKYGSKIALATQAAHQKAQFRLSRSMASIDSRIDTKTASPTKRSPFKRRSALQSARMSSLIQTTVLLEEAEHDSKQDDDSGSPGRKQQQAMLARHTAASQQVPMSSGNLFAKAEKPIANIIAPTATEGTFNKTERATFETGPTLEAGAEKKVEITQRESRPEIAVSSLVQARPESTTFPDIRPAPAASARASVYSIVPEVKHTSPALVQRKPSLRSPSLASEVFVTPRQSTDDNSDTMSERRKSYGSVNSNSTRSSVAAVFRKISPLIRLTREKSVNSHVDTKNENSVSSLYSRMSLTGKRASAAALTPLSPNISDYSSPASVSSEFAPGENRRSASIMRGFRTHMSMRSDASKAPSRTTSSPAASPVIVSPKIEQQTDEKPSKFFSIFSKSARKTRVASSVLANSTISETKNTILTVPQSPFLVPTDAIDSIPAEVVVSHERVVLPEITTETTDVEELPLITLPLVPTATAVSEHDTAERGSFKTMYDDVYEEIDHPLPEIAPLKITVSRPAFYDNTVPESPGYPLSPGADYVDMSLFTEDSGASDQVKDIHSLIADIEIFKPSKSAEHEHEIQPTRSRGSRSSRSSKTSRTSTVRDSKSTLRAVADPKQERYVLVDTPMSDEDEADDADAENEEDDADGEEQEKKDNNEQMEYGEQDENVPVPPLHTAVPVINDTKIDSIELPAPVGAHVYARPRVLASNESLSSVLSAISQRKSPASSRPSSPLKRNYAPSSASSGSRSDDSGSVSEDATSVSFTVTTPSPTMKNMDDMKIVLFRGNAMVSEWGPNNRWDRLSDKEVRVLVTVTEDSGSIEVWPATTRPSVIESSASSIASGKKSVQFSFGDNTLSPSDDSQPMLTIPLSVQAVVRRTTAFDIHVKKSPSSANTMFRTRTAVEVDHMLNAVNSCRLDYRRLQSRPFSLSEPSIASSSDSSRSSVSSRFGGRGSVWYHPSLESGPDSARSSVVFPSGASVIVSGDEVLLVKDFKCRLFLRQNALKWRNLGPAKISIVGMPDDGDSRVMVKRADEQVVFDLAIGANTFEKIGRTGLAVHVMDEQEDQISAVTDGDSRIAVYMLQFKGEKETSLVDRAIRESI
ncbi:hypothetical protein V1512DRAFT_248068 [Lipomyces arxii]|uniref:uncharacterized protein n=1 Tax=Lipomyces arxii TaxID=56418 RepID=UPI0034CE9BE7